MKDKKYCKVRDNFHNRSNYDYHFIIKDLAEEFKKQFTCLGENNEKYITLTVPIQKEAARIDKNGEEITKNKSHILQRFMTSSLSNLANNLSERIYKIRCTLNIATIFLNIKILKMIWQNTNVYVVTKIINKFHEKSKELFLNTYKYSTEYNNKFISFLQKGIYPYENIDDWKNLALKKLK